MIRLATIPFQQTMSASIQVAQQKLADTQLQLNSGKKAQDLAGLGSDAVWTLNARTMLSRQQAQTAQAKQLGTTLSLYDANITSIDNMALDLKKTLMTAIGTGDGASLQGTIEGAFGLFRAALNATDGNEVLFGGSRIDEQPFTPQSLADTAGKTVADAFSNDDVRTSARVGDGVDVTYGITASQVGSGMFGVFRTLAEAGTIGDHPTDAQMTALKDAVSQLTDAMSQVRSVNSGNGLRQNQVEELATRGEARGDLLKQLISDTEDADYGEIATNLAQQKTRLEASYSVFTQLSSLSLVNFLR